MKKIKQKIQISDKGATLLLVFLGIQILFAGYIILTLLLSILGLDIKLLGDPTILFSLGIYAIIIYVGISFFRGKTYGWYGEVSLYIILLLKNILFFISTIIVLLFKESLFKNMPLPTMKLNGNVVWAIIEFIVSGVMVKLLFSNDTINGFNFRNSSKASLVIKVTVTVVIVIALYFGASFLLIKK